MKNLATKWKGIATLLLCLFVFGIMPAMAQFTKAPRTQHHAMQTEALRSLTSEGIVSLDCSDISGFILGDPTALTSWGITAPDEYVIAADYINGTYYVSTYPNGVIGTIDPTTHAFTAITTSSNAHAIAYNPANGQLYGYNVEESTLCRVDITTGATTPVITINSSDLLLAFTITNEGRFLFVNSDSDAICELDTTTGDLSVLMTATFDVNYIQGIGMDREANTPYWAAYNATDMTAPLYALDLANSTMSLVGQFSTEVAAIATRTLAPTDAVRAAAPTNFTVTPDPNHGLSAELSWTNPTVDLGGNALSALTSIELYRDNTLLQSFANPTVGGDMTYSDNAVPTDGNYTYRVYGVTVDGNGASASVRVAIGNLCGITINMQDAYGDGWNGASIEILDANNNVVATCTCPASTQTETVMLTVGTYTFNWVAGSWDDECTFSITDSYGLPLYDASVAPAAGTFFTYNNTCEAPEFHTVSGTVTASASSQPIAGATITVSGLNRTRVATTDATGAYAMDSIIAGFPYSFTVSADGFNGTAQTFANIASDTTVNFALSAPTMDITYAGPIDVTTTQGLNTQFTPITVSNNGDGTLTWSTGVEYVRGRSVSNEAAQYEFVTSPRVKGNAGNADVCPTTAEIAGAPTRDAWDLLSTINASTAGQQGIATDGQYIYTCSWQSAPTSGNVFCKYDLQGNFIEGFDIAGVSGLRDLTYDGTYFYAGAGANALYQMDFNSRTLVSTINTAVSTIRHCSYDPQADGFWIGNWTDLYLVDRTGAIVVTGPAVDNVYGSAYDGYSAGGPYIWLFTQSAGTVGSAVFAQYDIAANALTNNTFDISTNQTALTSDGIAGGAFSTDALVGGKFVIMANTQQDPNLISVYEIADAGWLSAAPGSGTIVPSQSTDITLNFDGNNPIGDYQATLTINSSNPNVGQEVIPVTFHIIAPDCDAPTNLQVTATDYTYNALTWDVPANSTDLVEYRLYKNGSNTEFATTTSTSYNDTVAPGNYCYIVKAYYLDGTTPCLSYPTDTVCVDMLHAPSMTVNPTSLSLNTMSGVASVAATAAVEAYTLATDITVSTNAPFEVSADGTTFGATATIPATVNHIQSTVYVRIAATATPGSYTDVATLTSDDVTATINLSGLVVDCSEANDVPFVEDFEDELTACWQNIDRDGDGNVWFNATDLGFTAHGGSGAYVSASYINGVGALTPDNWLISPAINIPAEGAHMNWYDAAQDGSYPADYYQVMVSTGNTPSDFSNIVFSVTLSSANWTERYVNLSDFAGQTVYIAFVHMNSYDNYMMKIDDINIEAGVGIDENEANAIRVFPNPATNMINVEAQGFEQYELVNMLGQTVKSNRLANGQANINVSNLSNGVYFVRLINGSNVETIKVVKK